MFGSGEDTTVGFSRYIPLIGGDVGPLTSEEIASFDAKERLTDAARFDRIALVDLDFDLTELLDVDLAEATQDVADMVALALQGLKVADLEGRVRAAQTTLVLAKEAAKVLDELQAERRAAEAVKTGAEIAFDAARGTLDGIEAAIEGALDIVAAAANVIDDVGEFFEDVGGIIAFGAHIAALETAKIAVSIFGSPADVAAIQADIDEAFRQKERHDEAVAARREAESDLERFARELQEADIEFTEAERALRDAEDAFDRTVDRVAQAVEEFRKDFQTDSIEKLTARATALEATLDREQAEFDAQLKDLQERGFFTDAKGGVFDVLGALAKVPVGVLNEIDKATVNLIDTSEIAAELEVGVEAFAQAGLLIDFQLENGAVESDLDYALTSTAVYDDVADTFTISALAESAETGDSLAFETVSPDLSFFAGIAYHAGATFDVLFDAVADVGGFTLFDTGPLRFVEEVVLDGVVKVIDFDSEGFSGFDLPLPDPVDDILDVRFEAPELRTTGRLAEVSADPFTDPEGFVDMEAMADVLADLAALRFDVSPEFRKLLEDAGLEGDFAEADFATAMRAAVAAVFEAIQGGGDTDGDGVVPIFVLGSAEKGADAIFHFDTITPDLSALDIAETGQFGFFVSSGASENVVEVTVDVDQLVATAVNAALGNGSGAVVNPLDLEIDLKDVLKTANLSDEEIKEVRKFVSAKLDLEVADFDVRAGANFTQEFALTVEDIDFRIVFEDGTTAAVAASEGGEIVIGNASRLVDTNGNGQIDYALSLAPDAALFNDTEFGLNLGYTLDLLTAELDLKAQVPLDALLKDAVQIPGLELGTLEVFDDTFSFGPLLRIEGNADLASVDVFEEFFDFEAGEAGVEGAFVLAGQEQDGQEQAPGGGDEVDGIGPLAEVEEDQVLTGTGGADTLIGGAGDDRIKALGGADEVRAGAGKDKVAGGGGSDLISGGAGRDKINAGGGADTVDGGEDRDVLVGGRGSDVLEGGGGADVFKFARGHGADIVVDFEIGVDTLRFAKGAGSLDDLDIRQAGADTVIAFADAEIVLKDVLAEALLDADAFAF